MTEQEQFLRDAMERQGSTVYRLALCQGGRDWDEEHLKAWLIRATLNRCADLHRFRLRRPVLALEELPELAAVDRTAEASELWEAVARLPEKLRTAVHLYYAEGCRAEEIARLTGVPAATVRTRLRRARIKLKDLLGGIDDEREQIPDLDGETLRA